MTQQEIQERNKQIALAISVYKEILSSATILPVEESWDEALGYDNNERACKKYFPDGLIIQLKQ